MNQATGTDAGWTPRRIRVHPFRLLVAWAASAVALLVAAAIVPGASVNGAGAVLATLAIALLNAILPPILAALRLPFTVAAGFVLGLLLDAWMILLASRLLPGQLTVASPWAALGVALVAAAVTIGIDSLLGMDDDDSYTLRVIQRIARRSKAAKHTDKPGIVFLEIDGLALPVLEHAMRSGSAPNLARWVASGTHALTEWETDLSSQTGASQAGILLGSNDDIPAFRWVEKERGKVMSCSSAADCAELERRLTTEHGLLRGGGSSRGNLLSGGADHVFLTVSRLDAERRANPGYRTFFANGWNVTRAIVLFAYEVVLEIIAAQRQVRRGVEPRGHRGGTYPFLRAGLCVVLRDLIVYGVLTDMLEGRSPVYATFSGYDEVAHHSGLESADTMEVLRKLDRQIARLDAARQYAPRPYEIVVLSDHGQTQGATFRQRNGYSLEELVRRAMGAQAAARIESGDENQLAVEHAIADATGNASRPERGREDVRGESAVVLASGNLGLIYLMDADHRLTLEEIDQRYPRLLPDLLANRYIGFAVVASERSGGLVLGRGGARLLADGRVEGTDPLAAYPCRTTDHLRRTSGFAHAPDILVGSYYDAELEEAAAFEELISFHGGVGAPQTRPFLLAPTTLPPAPEPLVGAEAVHRVLMGWRQHLEGAAVPVGARPE